MGYLVEKVEIEVVLFMVIFLWIFEGGEGADYMRDDKDGHRHNIL